LCLFTGVDGEAARRALGWGRVPHRTMPRPKPSAWDTWRVDIGPEDAVSKLDLLDAW